MSKMDLLYQTRGVREAAQFYFNKSLIKLSDKEIINLLLMYNNPSYYNPRKKQCKNRIEKRVNDIQEQMGKTIIHYKDVFM